MKKHRKAAQLLKDKWLLIATPLVLVLAGVAFAFNSHFANPFLLTYSASAVAEAESKVAPEPKYKPLDVADYDRRMLALAHVSATSSSATTTATSTRPTGPRLWPAKAAYPSAGAILPFHRIVAYYGNFYSKQMGVLGEYPRDVLLSKLRKEMEVWSAADPTTPVMPAIEYIAVTAQGYAGKDKKYRLRMPDDQIDRSLLLAQEVNGIVIIDLQVGLSSVRDELPLLDTYWAKENVHLALDPEFAMKRGAKPGTVIGTLDAADINYAANYLAEIVRKNNLPPKILIVHRFTQAMVTNSGNIKPLPEVQIVMDMDGWGTPERKKGTYNAFINPEPVQFTGVKLFYKNDLRPPSTRMLLPAEVLGLTPAPIFIQYQ